MNNQVGIRNWRVMVALISSLLLNMCFLHHLLAQQSTPDSLVLENFESYTEKAAPVRWKRPHKKSRSMLELVDQYERDNDFVEVISLDRGKALRVYAQNDSEQFVLINGSAYAWDLGMYPYLQWAWKAIRLPEGAREDVSSLNDSGAALYVVFEKIGLAGPGHSSTYTARCFRLDTQRNLERFVLLWFRQKKMG